MKLKRIEGQKKGNKQSSRKTQKQKQEKKFLAPKALLVRLERCAECCAAHRTPLRKVSNIKRDRIGSSQK
jgi:hypothetical protein